MMQVRLKVAIWSLLCLVIIFSASACKSWHVRSVDDLEFVSDVESRDEDFEGEDLLVVTTDRAFLMHTARRRTTTVAGNSFKLWKVSPHNRDITALDDLSPEEIARVLGWETTPPVGMIEIQKAAIVSMRRQENDTASIIVPLAVPTGILIFIGMMVVASAGSGRPLRVRGRRCVTPIASNSEWIDPIELAAVSLDERRVLGAIWTREAQAEHAAVAAFSKLSLELIALGAPPELVLRANRAAMQEVQHARLCFGVASAYTGHPIGPGPLPEALAGDTVDLVRIAREALIDGCLGEGLAAEIARVGAETATDPAIARVMRIQAREEAQHAEFAWAIVDWCLLIGGARIRKTLFAAVRGEMPPCDDMPQHGRVPRRVVEPMLDTLVAEARERLAHQAGAAAA